MAATKKQPLSLVPPTPEDAALVAEQTATPQPANIDMTTMTPTDATELERLVAETKATQARIKELKAALPTISKLDKVIQRQREQPKWLPQLINGRIAERVKAGQPYDAAVEQVLHYIRTLVSEPPMAVEPTAPTSAE